MPEAQQLQLLGAALVWAFTQGWKLISTNYTPEQRDRVLKAVAAGASAFAGACVALVGVVNDLHEGKIDPVNLGTLVTAVVVMAQVFGISQALHFGKKWVLGLFKQ